VKDREKAEESKREKQKKKRENLQGSSSLAMGPKYRPVIFFSSISGLVAKYNGVNAPLSTG
jgi:hypothetical protein